MRAPTVIKIIFFLLFLILMVFFVFENIDPVPIWIPMFKGRHFGLIYIILASYVLGASNAFWVITLIHRERKKKQKLEESASEKEEVLFEEDEG
ncbi:MAG: hypothetical protein HQL15_01540 [Candidatus Omnitrophica bacterium]|nr:hypothetical protein [Candidatus Omnitrophota bacterium]